MADGCSVGRRVPSLDLIPSMPGWIFSGLVVVGVGVGGGLVSLSSSFVGEKVEREDNFLFEGADGYWRAGLLVSRGFGVECEALPFRCGAAGVGGSGEGDGVREDCGAVI